MNKNLPMQFFIFIFGSHWNDRTRGILATATARPAAKIVTALLAQFLLP
jgi:hypothetical protein